VRHREALSGFLAATLIAPIAFAGEPDPDSELLRAALEPIGSVPIAGQSGFFAWQSAACDPDGNVFLLVVPHTRPGDVDPSTGHLRLPPKPRGVLRVSADGERRSLFDPGTHAELAEAEEVVTLAMAIGDAGALTVLVWARWLDEGGALGEAAGQYLVPFDEKGRPVSAHEVDWRQMQVRQFELFGSGDYLLRGLRIGTDTARLAILPKGGAGLRDVMGWPNYPNEWLDEPTDGAVASFEHMARGGDGRIYLTGRDRGGDEHLVFSVAASPGHSEEVFRLLKMPRTYRLLGWQAAGRRLAAAYEERAPSDGENPRWWIAVYGAVGDYDYQPQRIYGPAPGPPLCFQHDDAGDRFTFFSQGEQGATLLTMMRRR
jgi:hypothetical protein